MLKNNTIFSVKKPRYVRINTLLVTLKRGIAWFREEGWSLMPKCSSYVEHLNVVKNLRKPNFIQDFHIPELLVFPSDTTFHNHPGYQNGEIILQDKVISFGASKLLMFLSFLLFFYTFRLVVFHRYC